MVFEQTVTPVSGDKVALRAETVCLHGDGGSALEFARLINAELKRCGVEIR
jgi:UPF0271 protein